jgi:hypothetical protein
MTVIASNATFKIRIDFGKATEDLKKLDAERVAASREELRERQEEDRKRKEESGREIQRGQAFRLNPLNPLETVLSAIGSVAPGAANSIRATINASEEAFPFIKGIAKGTADRITEHLPEELRTAARMAIGKSLEATGAASTTLADLKAKNDAIAPTYEMLKDLTRLDIVAGGKAPQAGDLIKQAQAMYKVMWGRMELKRAIDRRSMETVGEALGRGAADFMTR